MIQNNVCRVLYNTLKELGLLHILSMRNCCCPAYNSFIAIVIFIDEKGEEASTKEGSWSLSGP